MSQSSLFCAARSAVSFDDGAVDHQPVRRSLASCEGREDVFPDAAFGPAFEAVVEGFAGAILCRRIRPPSARADDVNADDVNNATENPTIINPLKATGVGWQKRFNARPLYIGNQNKSDITNLPVWRSESSHNQIGYPDRGSGP